MILFANIVAGIGNVLSLFLDFFTFMIIAYAVLQWVSADPYNPIVRFITRTVDPLLSFIRRYLPVVFGGIDFSPLILIAAIAFFRTALVGSLLEWAITLKQGALYAPPMPRGETL